MKVWVAAISTVLFFGLMSGRIDAENKKNPPVARNLQTTSYSGACPNDMVEIQGDFCPEVVQNCLNLDMSVHNVNGYVRCMEYAPTQCKSKKLVPMHFCIDRYEWPNQKDIKPAIMVSWYDMKHSCESQGKRLCVDHEWSMACEGTDRLPYPYGLKRDVFACNIDHTQMSWFDASKSSMTIDIALKLDQRVASGSMPECVSSYGVHDMTGNVDEWVVNSSGRPYDSGLMGGHWVIGARNRCRPETVIHGPDTVYYEIGGRCCKDVE